VDLRFSGELPLRLRDQDRHQALEEELLDPARFLILLAVIFVNNRRYQCIGKPKKVYLFSCAFVKGATLFSSK